MYFIRTALMTTLLLAGHASATVLHSAPALAGFGDYYLQCAATNVTDVERAVIIDHLDYAGTVVLSLTTTVPPRATAQAIANPIPSAASCRVTFAGSTKSVRAHATYIDPVESRPDIVVPCE